MRRGRDACRLIAAFRRELSQRRALFSSCDWQLEGNSGLPIAEDSFKESIVGSSAHGSRELLDEGSRADENGKAVPLPSWRDSSQFWLFTGRSTSGCSSSATSSASYAELASSSAHFPQATRPLVASEHASYGSSHVRTDWHPSAERDFRSTYGNLQFYTPIRSPEPVSTSQESSSTCLPSRASPYRSVQQGFQWGDSQHAAVHAECLPSASYLAGSNGSLRWRSAPRRLFSSDAATATEIRGDPSPGSCSCSSSNDRSNGSSIRNTMSSSGASSQRPTHTSSSVVARSVGEAREPSASASLSSTTSVPASAYPSLTITYEGATSQGERGVGPGNLTNVRMAAVDDEVMNGGDGCKRISATQRERQSEKVAAPAGSGSLPAATSAAQLWRNRDILQPANLVSLARMLSGPPIA